MFEENIFYVLCFLWLFIFLFRLSGTSGCEKLFLDILFRLSIDKSNYWLFVMSFSDLEFKLRSFLFHLFGNFWKFCWIDIVSITCFLAFELIKWFIFLAFLFGICSLKFLKVILSSFVKLEFNEFSALVRWLSLISLRTKPCLWLFLSTRWLLHFLCLYRLCWV